MAGTEPFKLGELRLDQRNYRTGRTATQRDAINAIVADQGMKLAALASDILEMGLSPGEPIWVTRDLEHAGMYVVLEGNRRITALKLMETPTLADGTTLESDFHRLGKDYATKPTNQVLGQLFPTREDAAPWLRRRHLSPASGVGIQRWESLAKARANRDQGLSAPRFLAVVDFLQDESDQWLRLQDVLDSKWTTVDRVLNAATVPSVLGLNIDPKSSTVSFDNGDAEAGRRLLLEILSSMASTDFKFSMIESDKDREVFVARFVPLSVKKPPVKPTVTAGGASGNTAQAAAVSLPASAKLPARTTPLQPAARTTLAPKSGPKAFNVQNDRLLHIYRECRHLSILTNENAAAVLLRVFIELSSEALLSEKNVPIPATVKNKTSWDDIGISLPAKIRAVLAFLDPSGNDKKFQQARLNLDPASQASASITTLHGYIHNRHLNPNVITIREAWDNWELYLRLLHAAR